MIEVQDAEVWNFMRIIFQADCISSFQNPDLVKMGVFCRIVAKGFVQTKKMILLK